MGFFFFIRTTFYIQKKIIKNSPKFESKILKSRSSKLEQFKEFFWNLFVDQDKLATSINCVVHQ